MARVPDAGLTFVEQDGGGSTLHQAAKAGGGNAGRESGKITEQLEELQAERLAGLLLCGLDREIRGDLGSMVAVGVEHPESQNGALMLGAIQVASNESGDIVEELITVHGLRWCGSGFAG